MDKQSTIALLICPGCGQPMRASTSPKSKFFPLPKSRIFECNRCAVIATTSDVLLADNEQHAH
ncbi:MAG: hypothetical protein WA851_10365 [Xanthobacteraceae bacterium]